MTHLLADLGLVDFDLGCSTSRWAVLQQRCCPSKTVEHPKSKSTQPRSARRWVILYGENYLKRNALAGRAGQRGQPLDGPARHEGLVAPVYLGHSLLDQRNPKLISFCLKVTI